MSSVKVLVPATTANLGPGFDCLGLALSLQNEVTFSAAGDFVELQVGQDALANMVLEITAAGIDAGQIPRDKSNLIVRSAATVFEQAGRTPTRLTVDILSRIPIASGLGSSSSAIVAGLMAANLLVEAGLSTMDILQIAAEMEGHPDNVAPALLGGLVLGVRYTDEAGYDHFHVEEIPIRPLRAAVVLPDVSLLTEEARQILPDQVSRQDALDNAAHLALLVRSLASGNQDVLRLAMDDHIHQPFRLPLIPGASEAIAAGYRAGATGIALSGAGPSLIAIARSDHEEIAAAMMTAFTSFDTASRHWIVDAVKEGASASLGG